MAEIELLSDPFHQQTAKSDPIYTDKVVANANEQRALTAQASPFTPTRALPVCRANALARSR